MSERDGRREPSNTDPSTAGLDELLQAAASAAAHYRTGVGDRPVTAAAGISDLRSMISSTLPPAGDPAATVIADLIEWGERGTVATAGPRYFGFVNGGTLPAALAADVLTAAWDQNAAMAVMSPLASVTEEVAARWILDLLGLPAHCAVGFVTGGQSANTTGLAVARHRVLAEAGWDVEADGLHGAPRVHVVVGSQRHATIDAAARVVGLGRPGVVVDVDDQGRMRPDDLEAKLGTLDGPAIVCVQAGNVVSGAFDPFEEIVSIVHRRGGWVHVDGAFGGWAAASATSRQLTAGMAGADSWAVDGHKLLNVPYDCGFAISAHPEAHQATCTSLASYYVTGGQDAPRDGMSFVLDASRRARGVATYAALRNLGRDGVDELIARMCRHARHLADRMSDEPGIEVLNDVVFNQVVLRFDDDDARTEAVIAAVQRDGTCWAGGASWFGRSVMRWSVANWLTTSEDIDRSVDAVLRCHRSNP